MKKISLLALFIAVVGIVNAQNVKFSTAKANAGSIVKFSYNPKNTKLEKYDEITCTGFSFFSAHKVISKTIKLIKENGLYTGEIKTTDSTSLVALSFDVGMEKDENLKGYLLELNKKGVAQAETYANEAYIYSDFGKYYLGIEEDNKRAILLYKKALLLKPDLKEKILISYLTAEQKFDKINGTKLINAQILSNSKIVNSNENDLTLSLNLYKLLKNKIAADSIKNLIIKRFPAGNLAYSYDMDKLVKMEDAFAQEKLLKSIIEKFKLAPSINKDLTRLNTINRIVATSFLDAKNYQKFDEYASKITDKMRLASMYNSFAWPLAEANENVDLAIEKSKKSLELLNLAKADPIPNSYNSKEDYLAAIATSYSSYADTYAYLLYRKGMYKEALAMQEQAISGKLKIAKDVNERYVTYLIKNNLNDKAYSIAEQMIRTGNASNLIKNDFKKLFVVLNKTGNVDDYLLLLNKEAEDTELKDLAAKMLNLQAPDFTLQNLNGEMVKLSDLKGKTVILDFWATWCGPCKASFPAMQKAVNKYANNSNVVFLFINTWQKEGDRNKIVADFIKEKQYTFNVLLDTKNKNNPDKFDVVDAYKIDGIPTKYIIGPDGNIKFKSVGLLSSEGAIVKEIDNMITLLTPNISVN